MASSVSSCPLKPAVSVQDLITLGARLHIPFTIQARSAFGFYFSYVMVVFRVIVSIFWYVSILLFLRQPHLRLSASNILGHRYGIGTYNGAECVR